jgi:hypothetical protein
VGAKVVLWIPYSNQQIETKNLKIIKMDGSVAELAYALFCGTRRLSFFRVLMEQSMGLLTELNQG